MAVARNGSTWLRYEDAGTGEPLLLIMGLGGSSRAWWRLLPRLVGHARCLTFDHRGTGLSDRIRGPLSMDDLVADALAVLDAARVDRAHVLGVSMGGMVAQHLALDHPDRVRSVVLGATTSAGRQGPPPWRLLAAGAARPVLGRERMWDFLAPALYAERTRREHPERILEDLRIRETDPTPAATFHAQVLAIAAHRTDHRLHELAGLPVTVFHGDEDRLVPPERGTALAAALPGARSATLQRCGHITTTDAEEETAAVVLGHLAAAGAAQRSSRAA